MGVYPSMVFVVKWFVRICGRLIHGKVTSLGLLGGGAESWVLYGGHMIYGA